MPLEPGELMYGFGLQMLSFQQRSKKRTVRVNADPKVDSGDTHAPVPFYVTTRGYGLLVDTFRHATYYCGEAHPRPQHAVAATELEVNTPQMMRAEGPPPVWPGACGSAPLRGRGRVPFRGP